MASRKTRDQSKQQEGTATCSKAGLGKRRREDKTIAVHRGKLGDVRTCEVCMRESSVHIIILVQPRDRGRWGGAGRSRTAGKPSRPTSQAGVGKGGTPVVVE